MTTIPESEIDRVTKIVMDPTKFTEIEPHRFVAEASDLGWPPGKIPLSFATNLGNGLPLRMTAHDEHSYTYHQDGGVITLIVFND